MNFENFERGYLLPKGCKDLIEVIGLRAHSKILLKLPLLHSNAQTGTSAKPASPAPAMKGDVFVSDQTTVKELAALLREEAFKIIADAVQLGIFATLNQPLGFKAISQIVQKYGYTAKRAS
jgi:hypothetical protein